MCIKDITREESFVSRVANGRVTAHLRGGEQREPRQAATERRESSDHSSSRHAPWPLAKHEHEVGVSIRVSRGSAYCLTASVSYANTGKYYTFL